MSDHPFPETKTVHVEGSPLAYVEQGDGAPVVLVHGGTADLRVWADQMRDLGRSHRAIAYSQRYCRPNPGIDPDVPNDFDRHVDDLAGFVRVIGAEPAHVVASSSGAFISLLAAMRFPDRFRSLVLAEPPALTLFVSAPPGPMELLRLFATRPRTAVAVLSFALGAMVPATRAFQAGDDEKALRVFLRGVLGESFFAKLSPEDLQVLRDNVLTLRGGLVHEAPFPPLPDAEVRAVGIPVLLVTGEHSPAIFGRLSDRLEELLPHAERITIPGASHVMFQDDAPAFNAAVLAFLERHAHAAD